MTMEDNSVGWFQPERRCLFPISGIHVSHSLAKVLRKGEFEVRFDTAFQEVMRSCLRPDGNWISEEFIRCYTEIHHQGWGHSCEVFHEGVLVGGTYGIAIGSCFCAESMFHTVTNASKVALKHMIDRCRAQGFTIFDAQIMNPHLKSLGAYEVTHRQYMRALAKATDEDTPWSRGFR